MVWCGRLGWDASVTGVACIHGWYPVSMPKRTMPSDHTSALRPSYCMPAFISGAMCSRVPTIEPTPPSSGNSNAPLGSRPYRCVRPKSVICTRIVPAQQTGVA